MAHTLQQAGARYTTERLHAFTHQSISVKDEITPRSGSEMGEVKYINVIIMKHTMMRLYDNVAFIIDTERFMA